MSSKKYRNKQCVYCGQLATTGDHIPPASLFASPRPNNLIKVPSCKACNDGASKDDEYFRVQLALHEDMRGHPDVEGVLPDVIRGLENPAKHKFKEALVETTRVVQLFSASGAYQGVGVQLQMHLRRMERVAASVAQGLYYHERGVLLPDGFDATAHDTFRFIDLADEPGPSLRHLSEHIVTCKQKTVGNDVLTYWYMFFDEQGELYSDLTGKSVWGLRFYGREFFLCVTDEKVPAEWRTGATGITDGHYIRYITNDSAS